MSIPKNITKELIEKAIAELENSDIPTERLSYNYFLQAGGKSLPPKYVISIANKYANNKELDSEEFNAVEAKEFLKKLGFTVTEKNESRELPRIFIAPRSGEQSSKNFAKTIEGGYKKNELQRFFSPEDKEGLKDVDTLMIWGNKPSLKSRWDKMQKGDWVLFYQHGDISFAGKLLYKTHNKAIADELWGPQVGEDGKPVSWEYVFFLTDMKPVNKPYKLMADLAGYKGSVVQGFLPFSEEGVKNIITQYGSVDNFLFEKSKKNEIKSMNESFVLSNLKKDIKNSGIQIQEKLITRFASSLLTKPFVILTGLSGSGKTKLAQAFAMWICENENQYRIVPVGADWTNREPLLGFPNALIQNDYKSDEYGVLRLIIEANSNSDKPYFLILDEMNLSHVERYFADFLSVMESNGKISLHPGSEVWNDVPNEIGFPKNLFIIGTVNIDETTYMFSPKVLDRANVIEFRVTAPEMESYLQSSSFISLENLEGLGATMAGSFVEIAKDDSLEARDINELNKLLMQFFYELKKTGAEFGYRSASEILRFAAVTNKIEPTWSITEITDAAIMQKLLPKVHGSRRKLEPVLKILGTLCLVGEQKFDDLLARKAEIDYSNSSLIKYPVSLEKILRMYDNLISNGFTSYAEA